MLRLISVEKGKVGILRTYQHDRLGLFEVVTVWPNAGAAIIHLQTFKIRSVKKGAAHQSRGQRSIKSRAGRQ